MMNIGQAIASGWTIGRASISLTMRATLAPSVTLCDCVGGLSGTALETSTS
jgi:hypothetical protein